MKINQLKAGVFLSYLSMALRNTISLFFTPITLRLLGQSEYGLYSLVSSIVQYLGILNFGFGSSYIRYYTKYKVLNDNENIDKLNGMFLTIFLIIGFIALVLGLILSANIESILGTQLSLQEIIKAKILMIILVINIALSFPNIIFNSFITANEQFIFMKKVQILKTIINPLITISILSLGFKSIGMVIGTSLLNLVIEIWTIIFCFKKLQIKFSFSNFNFKLMKEIATFSSFIFMNLVINQINWNVDKFILGRYWGTISVAIYGISTQLTTYFRYFSTAISDVFTPRIHKIIAKPNSNQELTNLFTKVGRIQFSILSLILTGLIFFGKNFIIFWAGKDYIKSFYVIITLCIPLTIPLIQNLGLEIQRAKNLHQFRSWTYLFIAILNISISIPLSKRYCEIGAAIGTAISLIIGNIFIMNWFYHKRIGLDIIYFWHQISKLFIGIIPSIIIGWIMNYFLSLDNLIVFILSVISYTLIYSSFLWLLGLNDFEKHLIKRLVKRFSSLIIKDKSYEY